MKKKTVTIGIAAHNEEKSIAKLLGSIAKQTADNFVLQNVLVVCDGCTDNTEQIAKNLAKTHRYIRVLNDGKRLGQSERLNQLFQMSTSDVFVALDADVLLANDTTLRELVAPFYTSSVGLVGGKNIPYAPRTFVEKIVVTYENFWTEVNQNVNSGNNIHNCPGCIWAASKKLLSTLHIPSHVTASDHYMYFKNKQQNFSFIFARTALCYFRVPATLRDYLLQSGRFLKTQSEMKDLESAYSDEYAIPAKVKLKAYIHSLTKEPFFMSMALLLQVVLRIYIRINSPNYSNGLWTQVQSSKS